LGRPPYGRVESIGLAASLRYEVMLWSNWVNGGSPETGVDETLRRACPGSIVLAHDGGSQPNATLMRRLDRLLGAMTDAGYNPPVLPMPRARPVPVEAADGP
jgi:hypothetical protein